MAAGAYFAWYPFDQSAIEETTEYIEEAASLDVKKGTPILKDADGRVDACAATPTSIYGITLEDSHNGSAGANKILVSRLRPGDKWVIPLLETLAQNLLGVAAGEVGIVKDATTGYWYGSTADAGDQARIVDFITGPGGMYIGDTKAPVMVVFHDSKLQVN